jgi:hypothetical protein
MTKAIEEILAPKPEARPRIYAYSIDDIPHRGLLKVGQTTRDVRRRIGEQLKTAAIKNFRIELDESAERDDGTIFTDHDVRMALVRRGSKNAELEWMRCSVKDVKTVLAELRTGQRFTGTHHQTFAMRREQAEAVNKTHEYFHSIWKENLHYLSARQEIGCHARARGHLQACGGGCLADRPRVPCGLRRLAVPLASV